MYRSVQEQSVTAVFKQMANAIIAGASASSPPPAKELKEKAGTPNQLLHALSSLVSTKETVDTPIAHCISAFLPVSEAEEPTANQADDQRHCLERQPQSLMPTTFCNALRLPGQFLRIGPFEVRPAEGSEVPFGRVYQAIPYDSISRLAGYVGLDAYGLYIREVPDLKEHGLKPSCNGIWIRQPEETAFRRLSPGQAERITPDSQIYIGGDGLSAQTGLALYVMP